MAQGHFTKDEAKFAADTVEEIYKALPKTKQREFLGHLNDVMLFISATGKQAPEGASK